MVILPPFQLSSCLSSNVGLACVSHLSNAAATAAATGKNAEGDETGSGQS